MAALSCFIYGSNLLSYLGSLVKQMVMVQVPLEALHVYNCKLHPFTFSHAKILSGRTTAIKICHVGQRHEVVMKLLNFMLYRHHKQLQIKYTLYNLHLWKEETWD